MELRGLTEILKNSGTLHGIAAPPEPHEGERLDEYEVRFNEWWTRTHFWQVERINCGP